MAQIGTTSPIFIPFTQAPARPIEPGECYFYLKIREAAVYFPAAFWVRPQHLLVTSQVELRHPAWQTDRLLSLRYLRPIERNQPRVLGISPNLLGLIPARLDSFTLSIDFLADSQNLFAKLASTINEGQFFKELNLVPGVQAVAGIVSRIAGGLLKAFLKEEEQVPLLKFSGSFNLVAESQEGPPDQERLREGLYVILGSLDPTYPLPSGADAQHLYVPQNGGLMLGGGPVETLSYVILEVRRADLRSVEVDGGAEWASRLREAKAVEDKTRLAPNPSRLTEYREQWGGLMEAFAFLLRNDPNFLDRDADRIINTAIDAGLAKFEVANQKFTRHESASRGPVETKGFPNIGSLGGLDDPEESNAEAEWEKEFTRRLLPGRQGVRSAEATQYEAEEAEARREMAALGLLDAAAG